MTTELFAANLRRVQEAFAAELNCDPAAFEGHELTITAKRPEGQTEEFFALFGTMGTGTVVCVEPEYVEFAREHAPDKHYRAMYAVFMQPLLDEAARRGENLVPRHAGLGFALAKLPPEPVLPPGLACALWNVTEAERRQADGVFTNALDEPGDTHISTELREAVAIVDGAGAPVAVAGIWKQFGVLSEIGVDVRRDARGQGLGAAVVTLATRRIVETGGVPTYHCAPTNLRSARTALACGYMPSVSLAKISRERT